MRAIPVDGEKIRMISAGSTVEEVQEWAELNGGERRRTGNQARTEDGRAQWVVYAFVPGDAGERPETVKIKVASRDMPEPGAFGDVLEFDALAVMPYVDSASGRVALSWRADGVRTAGARKPAPIASAS
jgi:hypothetical protein